MLKAARPKFHQLSDARRAGPPEMPESRYFVKFIMPVLMFAPPVWTGQVLKVKHLLPKWCFYYVHGGDFFYFEACCLKSSHQSWCADFHYFETFWRRKKEKERCCGFTEWFRLISGVRERTWNNADEGSRCLQSGRTSLRIRCW